MATAFHRNTMTNTEGGTDDEEFRVAAVKDRVDTTMQVWMGLTMGCAKCHSHKYDPITQDEYYRFYAFFNQTADTDQPDESPVIPAPTPEITAKLQEIESEALRGACQAGEAGTDAGRRPAEADPRRDRRAGEIPAGDPDGAGDGRAAGGKRRTTRLLRKGNFLDPGDAVEPGVPRALPSLPDRHCR